MNAADRKSRWDILGTFFLRSTGFPFSLLKQFRFEKTWRMLERWWSLHSEISQIGKCLETETNKLFRIQEAAILKSNLLNVFRKLNQSLPISPQSWMIAYPNLSAIIEKWNDCLRQEDKTLEEARDIFGVELHEKRRELRVLVETNTYFREAMFLSSNGSSETAAESYLNSSTDSRNSDTRQRERLFMSYLQRFCTKNETTSFFGPINYGRFHSEQEANISISFQKGLDGKNVAQNQIFLSHWACNELARAVSREPGIRAYVVPRAYPTYTFVRGRPYYFGIEETEVPEEAHPILELVDGRRTFKEIRDLLHNPPEALFWNICDQLVQGKIISDSFMISPFALNGEEDLMQFLETIPDSPSKSEWTKRLAEIKRLISRIKLGTFQARISVLEEMERRVQLWTGNNPKRGQGSFYKDRSIIFEEAKGLVDNCIIGGDLYIKLRENLGQILSVLSLFAIADWELWQYAGAAVLEQLSPTTCKMALAEFWNDFDDIYKVTIETEGFRKREMTIKTAIESFQAQVQHGRQPSELTTMVREILSNGGFLRQKDYPLCVSPDFLIASSSATAINEGRYQIYLGEIHPHLYPNTYDTFLYFCKDKESHAEELVRTLRGLSSPHQVLELILRKNAKLGPIDLKGIALSMQEPPSEDKKEHIPMTSLEVIIKDNAVMLTDKDNESRTFLIPNDITEEPGYAFLKIFSLPYINFVPVFSQKFSPRLEWNEIVYQRAQWQLDESDLKSLSTAAGFELFLEGYKLKKANDLPGCVFVRHPLEKKPFFLDFKNFLLIENFRHSVHRLPQARLSEFAPGEDELWLEIKEERYSCEFRTGMYIMKKGDNHDST